MTEAEWRECVDPEPLLRFLQKSGTLSQRKARLLAAACCRRIWHLLPSEACKKAVQYAELSADGRIAEEERKEVVRAALEAYIHSAAAAEVALQGTWDPLDCLADEHNRDDYERLYERACQEARQRPGDASEAWASREAAHAAYYLLLADPSFLSFACYHAASAVTFFYESDGWEAYCKRGDSEERVTQKKIAEDIFGSLPFRPVCIDPLLLTWHDGLLTSMAQRMYVSRDFSDMPVLADALEEAGCTNPDVLAHCRMSGDHVRGCWVADLVLEKS
jgi:hypothetical protein